MHRSYRGPLSVVSQAYPAVSLRTRVCCSAMSEHPSATIQNCIALQAPASRALLVVSRALLVVSLALSRVSRPLPRACSARCRALPCVSRTPRAGHPYRMLYYGPTTPCRGLIWPCRGRVLACPCPPATHPIPQYNALYRDQVQNGQLPSLLPAYFFFSHNFFPYSSYWKTTKYIYIYIYINIFKFFFHFPVGPNKFIKIYFIYMFFFQLSHILKPQKKKKKNFFSSFFFYVLFTKHTITQFMHNNSCFAHHSHVKHNACSVLILSRDCLGNHIPKP